MSKTVCIVKTRASISWGMVYDSIIYSTLYGYMPYTCIYRSQKAILSHYPLLFNMLWISCCFIWFIIIRMDKISSGHNQIT